ncbi:hypothetical protein CR970_00050 [Candidatus Saccharibacteria bacterium]|nr:MAG: hypothetical protein CR970_00050 [Candidatus Saccharibacteria bacterium]
MEEHDIAPKQETVDLGTEAMTQTFAEAPVYRKTGTVTAELADVEQEVKTVLSNGNVETVNTAKVGDYIVTNPGKETYVLDPETFGKRYDPTDKDGTFRAKGMIRAFRNNTGSPVSIVPPWGGTQTGDADCMFATIYDPENPDEIGTDRYIIGHEEFKETYEPAEVEPVSPEETAQSLGSIALE